MSLVKRSLMNLVRSPARTIAVVAMLAVSLGLGLTMAVIHNAVANQLGAISGEIGTDISVSPAGYEGLPSGNVVLPQAEIAKLKDLAHVVSVRPSLSVAYSGSTRIRAANPNGASHIPVLSVLGLDPAMADPALRNDEKINVVDGAYFTAEDPEANVMVVGQALAEGNNLHVGSTVDINGTPVQVIGLYNTGQTNNTIVMPIATVQRLYNLQGANGVTVVADDVSNVSTVVQEIRTVFDTKTADVLTATQEYNKIHSNIAEAVGVSQTAMIVTFIVAAAIILLAVFLVMRQRVREIGIMKAIGASNWRIGFGFGLETLFICLASTVMGTVLAFVFVKKGLTGIQLADISSDIFLIAIAVTIALALIGSIIPVWYIARVRPAEVLRNE